MKLANLVTTVSDTHAFELRSETGGFGLHGSFTALGDRLLGVLNGIGGERWNPGSDAAIPALFSRNQLEGKRRCREALQASYRLTAAVGTPLIAMSARLVDQEGLPIILESLPSLLEGAHPTAATGLSASVVRRPAITLISRNSWWRPGLIPSHSARIPCPRSCAGWHSPGPETHGFPAQRTAAIHHAPEMPAIASATTARAATETPGTSTASHHPALARTRTVAAVNASRAARARRGCRLTAAMPAMTSAATPIPTAGQLT